MTAKAVGDRAGAGDEILWTQFILAAALARAGRRLVPPRAGGEEPTFSFADTHAGGGRLAVPARLAALLAQRPSFSVQVFHDAVADGPSGPDTHPGSWVLAARVLGADPALAVEIDVNDLDPAVIAQARNHREGGWVRFWSHDWFQFLRHRIAMTRRPDFIFIDPPEDDPRGPDYAIDAAILLESLTIPYMITYPATRSQTAIDQIGRLGLEYHRGAAGQGAVLGGGAETVVLDILGDLGRLAALLGGRFVPRLPRPPADDYCI